MLRRAAVPGLGAATARCAAAVPDGRRRALLPGCVAPGQRN